MSVTIARSDPIPRTDTKLLPFTIVEDETGDPVGLSGATITWELRKRTAYEAEITLDDAGVSITERDNAAGEFSVRIEQNATEDLEFATYRERLRIVDDDGNQTTWIGEVPIVEDA